MKFELGYGKPEFSRDLHAMIVAAAGFLIVRLPFLQTATWESVKSDLITLVSIAVVAGLKSYLTAANVTAPEPPKP